MKRYLSLFSVLIILLIPHHAHAASLSNLFIAITDSKTAVNTHDEAAYSKHIQTLEQSFKAVPKKHIKLEKEITRQINQLQKTSDRKERLELLQNLSVNLVSYEKILNPVDKIKKRQDLKNALYPIITDMQQAVKDDNIKLALKDNTALNTAWTANEKIVRGDDIGRYGQIETALMMTRIALSKDTPDKAAALNQLNQLKTELDDYLSGKKAKSIETKDASILTTHLNDAVAAINHHKLSAARASLASFVSVWPNVEGDIRNSNAALYTKIEQQIPDYAGSLNSSNQAEIKNQLSALNDEIAAAINKNHYTFIDAALILLREGVEALLIIMALVTVTKNAGQVKATRWIVAGSLIGLALSAVIAFIFNQFFNNMGQGRELLEAVIGIGSVIFMIFIGAWLHSKSSIASWRKFIDKHTAQAITSGSVLSFSLVSFLSVFREGAETIIFYAGIAGKITTGQLILGIVAAIVVLTVIAVFFDKITAVIPIRQLFFIMSILIFVLAFKILGVSMHTFQVMGMMPNTTINHIPYISLIGLYPTVETLIPQLLLVVIAVIYLIVHQLRQRQVIVQQS